MPSVYAGIRHGHAAPTTIAATGDCRPCGKGIPETGQ